MIKLNDYKNELFNLFGIVKEISSFEIFKSQSFEEYVIDRVDKKHRRVDLVEKNDQESQENMDEVLELRLIC